MGSCTSKTKRRPYSDKSHEITEYISSRRDKERVKMHQAIESRRVIFLQKDSKAPILDIQSNPLYKNRKNINLGKVCSESQSKS